MGALNAKQRSPEIWQRSEGSKLEGQSCGMGGASSDSSRIGFDSLKPGRQDWVQGNIPVSTGLQNKGISGKIISQLVDETQKQLAYYEAQTEIQRQRLQELKQLAEDITTES